MSLYFASDFHLGIKNDHNTLLREKKIIEWLTSIEDDAEAIFLVGDVFDFWFEYKHVVPKGYVRLLGKLASMTDKGIAIHFFKGNHDMWTFDYLKNEIGLIIHSDEYEFNHNGHTFYIHHGDGLGPGDKTYKILKKIFRSKISIGLFSLLHPYFGIQFASFLSSSSRLNKIDKEHFSGRIEDEWLYIFAKSILKQKHVDFFIFGHRHLIFDEKINDTSRFINLGEWVNLPCYAQFKNNEMKVIRY